MKFTAKILPLVLASAALPLCAEWNIQAQPYLAWSGLEKGSDIFVSYGFKTKGDYSINVDTLMQVQDVDGADHLAYTHAYSRIGIKSPVTYNLGSTWKFNWQYRYVIPTTAGAQADGSYGTVSVRPTFTASFGSFLNLSLRTIVGLDLQREGYQVNPVGSGVPAKGTRLFVLAQEVIPEFVLDEGLTFTPYVAVSYGYVMAPPHGSKKSSNAVLFNPELSKQISSIEGLSVSLWYEEEAPFGTDKDLEMFQTEQIRYGMGVGYSF